MCCFNWRSTSSWNSTRREAFLLDDCSNDLAWFSFEEDLGYLSGGFENWILSAKLSFCRARLFSCSSNGLNSGLVATYLFVCSSSEISNWILKWCFGGADTYYACKSLLSSDFPSSLLCIEFTFDGWFETTRLNPVELSSLTCDISICGGLE